MSERARAFCLWLSGGPAPVRLAVGRAVATELGARHAVQVVGAGELEEPFEPVDPRSYAYVAAALLRHHVTVVVVAEAPVPAGRSGLPRLFEVGLDAPGADVDLVVSADAARAGESTRKILAALAAHGWSDGDDEYSLEEEAQVALRLEALGYL